MSYQPQISPQINASQSSSKRHISTSTVQKRLRELGLHGRIAAKKPLLKDTNNKKRLAWAMKQEQWNMFWDSSDGIEEYTTPVTGFINKCIEDVVPTVTARTYPNQGR